MFLKNIYIFLDTSYRGLRYFVNGISTLSLQEKPQIYTTVQISLLDCRVMKEKQTQNPDAIAFTAKNVYLPYIFWVFLVNCK